jgi:catechol 2,3-dioxygenase-like lactoylglutathione lyase family enzyme
VAFALEAEDFEAWQTRLAQAGIAIERIVDWEQGRRSIYFRDPAGNSIELAPLTLWGGGWKT